jgi:O-antigen ligase
LTSLGIHPFDLDPSHVAHRTYATRRLRRFVDVCAMVNVLIVLLFLLPSRLAAPQLSLLGRPALLVGLVLSAGWMMSRLHPQLAIVGPQPLRWAATVYLVAFLASYAAGFLRGLVPLESNAADRLLISTVAFLGIVVALADGIPNRTRLDDVVRTLVWCAAGMAFIGLIQATLDFDITQYMRIPGLVLHGDLPGFETRGSGFFRVASTTDHYIEFSAVMAMCLPFAIHVARFGRSPLVRQSAVVCGLLIAAAVPLTISRTGILALGVGMLAMLLVWPWRVRFNVAVLAIGLGAVMMVIRPGLLGTLRGLFTNLSSDSSIQARTEDYTVAYQYIAERPWFGRGQGTFVPDLYFVLDNQWLLQLITGGIVGVVALVALNLTAVSLAGLALRRAPTAEDRHLAGCLVAVQLIAVTVSFTFDSFSFGTFFLLLALCTGLTGAMWRLTHPNRRARNTSGAGLRRSAARQ